jgi:hypothetical protein
MAYDIVSVTASNPGPLSQGLDIESSQYLQVSWTATQSYTEVDISAWLYGDIVDNAFLPSIGTAYLTSTALAGPVEESFTFPDTVTEVSLFSNLDLPSGTYFLTLASTSPYGGGWSSGPVESGQSILTSLDGGVTVNPPQFSNPEGLVPSFPPASSFIMGDQQVFYDVTTTTATPEPPSITLVGTMAIVLIFQFRHPKRAR